MCVLHFVSSFVARISRTAATKCQKAESTGGKGIGNANAKANGNACQHRVKSREARWGSMSIQNISLPPTQAHTHTHVNTYMCTYICVHSLTQSCTFLTAVAVAVAVAALWRWRSFCVLPFGSFSSHMPQQRLRQWQRQRQRQNFFVVSFLLLFLLLRRILHTLPALYFCSLL